MAPRTAEDVLILSHGLHYFLVHQFHYTDQLALRNLEKIKTLYIGSNIVDGYCGHLTEKIPGNNPVF